MKILFSKTAIMLFFALLTSASAWALDQLTVGSYTFTTGSDDEGEYYVVDGTVALNALATFVNECNSTSGMRFKQTRDITYTHTTEWNDDTSTENNFSAIGCRNSSTVSNWYFRGTFDGGGFTISGIRIYKGGKTNVDDYQGLFGYISGNNSATVKNVILADARITGRNNVGGIVGYLRRGTVSNCRVESSVAIHSVQSNASSHGGVAGNSLGTISDCFSAATVSTNCNYVGAIAGSKSGTFERNYYVYTTCKGGVATGTLTSADIDGARVLREMVNITYTDADGNGQTADVPKLIEGCDSELNAGMYVVGDDITCTSTLSVNGDVHLILADGKTMTASAGINIADGYTLYIYGQQGGNGTLTVNGTVGSKGINGSHNDYGDGGVGGVGNAAITGNVVINSGIVYVTGGTGGEGGQGSRGYNDGDGGTGGVGINGLLTVNGGDVFIQGGEGGTGGIGGREGSSGSAGHGISGTVTYNATTIILQESGDNSTWSTMTSGSTSEKRYIRSAVPSTLTLYNDVPNDEAIADADGLLSTVTLSGRTLYKDGKWNTICLPFDVTLSGSPLEGATARTLTEASIDGSTLNLTFGGVVTDKLVAGTPYIIKWASGDDIVEPVFTGVTVTTTKHDFDNGESGDQRVRFIGTYNATTFEDGDNSVLIMGGGNTLYYPNEGAGLGAQRAYFKIGDGDALLARQLTAFSISFGDEETTGIISIENGQLTIENSWYTVDGRRLAQKPAQRGMYINGGKKVIVR